jgi:hypothetical protein
MTLLEWIESQPFHYNKVNVRPWGTYELQVIIEGRTAQLAEPRGWGWSEKDAFESILTDMMKHVNFHQNIKSWLGEERFNQITSILDGTSGEGNRTEVSSDSKRLEGYVGGSPEGPIDSGIPEQGSSRSGEADDSVSDHQGKHSESTNSP